jgi:hypothetical protein
MMKLQDVILKAMAKRITWMAAAEIAGVSDRTMRRIKQRYKEFACNGPVRQNTSAFCHPIEKGSLTTEMLISATLPDWAYAPTGLFL